jgi:hypothetical protein
MCHSVNPKIFGLHSATKIEQSGEKQFVIVMNRKSRIIMQDAHKIIQKAARIMEKVPGAIVSLRTTAPVCSQTKALLQENKVALV